MSMTCLAIIEPHIDIIGLYCTMESCFSGSWDNTMNEMQSGSGTSSRIQGHTDFVEHYCVGRGSLFMEEMMGT